ncbi:hypothetical protein A0U90_09100 [Kozakia baliensis]|nr:hypothetical protein A0U90_09100 [Kozakia baliensis]
MKAPKPRKIGRLRTQLTLLSRRLRQEAKNDPASWTRMLVLSAIDRLGEGATPSAIGREEDMRSSQVAALLRELEASELIERLADQADRRVTRLRLTPSGEHLLQQSRARRDLWLSEAMMRSLTEDEYRLLLKTGKLLEKLARYSP